jgi:ribosomal protein L28
MINYSRKKKNNLNNKFAKERKMSIDPRKYLGLGPLKKPLFGHNRSHALNATQKISKPNVQKRKITIDEKEYTVKLTAREIRTLDKKGIALK